MRWKLTILLLPVFIAVLFGSVWVRSVRVRRSSGGLDAGPGAGPDALGRGARLSGFIQPALHLGSGVQRDVLEDMRIDQGPGSDVIVPVKDRVVDVGDDVGP